MDAFNTLAIRTFYLCSLYQLDSINGRQDRLETPFKIKTFCLHTSTYTRHEQKPMHSKCSNKLTTQTHQPKANSQRKQRHACNGRKKKKAFLQGQCYPNHPLNIQIQDSNRSPLRQNHRPEPFSSPKRDTGTDTNNEAPAADTYVPGKRRKGTEAPPPTTPRTGRAQCE